MGISSFSVILAILPAFSALASPFAAVSTSLCPAPLAASLPPPAVGQLLEVMHHAEQVPLHVDLLAPSQVQPCQMLVVLDVAKPPALAHWIQGIWFRPKVAINSEAACGQPTWITGFTCAHTHCHGPAQWSRGAENRSRGRRCSGGLVLCATNTVRQCPLGV